MESAKSTMATISRVTSALNFKFFAPLVVWVVLQQKVILGFWILTIGTVYVFRWV